MSLVDVIDTLQDGKDVDDERIRTYRHVKDAVNAIRNFREIVDVFKPFNICLEDVLFVVCPWYDALIYVCTGHEMGPTSRGPLPDLLSQPNIPVYEPMLIEFIHRQLITFEDAAAELLQPVFDSDGDVSFDKKKLDLISSLAGRQFPVNLRIACMLGSMDMVPDWEQGLTDVSLTDAVLTTCRYSHLPADPSRSRTDILWRMLDLADDSFIREPLLSKAIGLVVEAGNEKLLMDFVERFDVLVDAWEHAEETGSTHLFEVLVRFTDPDEDVLERLIEYTKAYDSVEYIMTEFARCYDYGCVNGPSLVEAAINSKDPAMVEVILEQLNEDARPDSKMLDDILLHKMRHDDEPDARQNYISIILKLLNGPHGLDVSQPAMREIVRAYAHLIDAFIAKYPSLQPKFCGEACVQHRWTLARRLMGPEPQVTLQYVLSDVQKTRPLQWLWSDGTAEMKNAFLEPTPQVERHLHEHFLMAIDVGRVDLVRWWLHLHPDRARQHIAMERALASDHVGVIELLIKCGAPVDGLSHRKAFPRDPHRYENHTCVLEWVLRNSHDAWADSPVLQTDSLVPRTDLRAALRSVLSVGLIHVAQKLVTFGASPRDVRPLTVSRHAWKRVQTFLRQHNAPTKGISQK